MVEPGGIEPPTSCMPFIGDINDFNGLVCTVELDCLTFRQIQIISLKWRLRLDEFSTILVFFFKGDYLVQLKVLRRNIPTSFLS